MSPRRSSPLPLLIALLALALGGYAAWAASQGRGADPAVAAEIDSLRAEVAALRAAAVPVDTTVADSAAATSATQPAGTLPAVTTGTQPAPGAAPPAGGTTTPANRTTTP